MKSIVSKKTSDSFVEFVKIYRKFTIVRKYYDMPDLYQLDNYYSCFHQEDPGVYCLVRADIIPNEQSKLWNYIKVIKCVFKLGLQVMTLYFLLQTFSAERPHFRHNELTYGICVSSCQKLIDKVEADSRMSYYHGELGSNELVSIF